MAVELTIDQKAVVAVGEAMKAEEDGKALRRDLLRELRAIGTPIVPDVQSAVRQLPDISPAVAEPRLREAIASQTKLSVRMSGRYTGLRVWISTKGDPRGFRFAARAMNRGRGWRHPVFGTSAWVVQRSGREAWFESTVMRRKQEARDGVVAAVDAMARRIAARAKQEAGRQ